MRRLLAAVCITLAVVTAGGAVAQEEILSFDSNVVVRQDGTLDVTETITVNAEQREIRRDIYRDFPTRYREDNGLFRTVGFDVVEVLRNGEPEPWFTEGSAGGVRVYIGDADVVLAPGRHTYTLRYETTRQLGFFDGHDELYWNVTGNFWAFPIRQATARIVLPEGAIVRNWAAYTGPPGATGSNATGQNAGPRTVVFRTTQPLGPQEGLTVAVSWQKGVVSEPAEGPVRVLLDNLGFAVALAGVPLILVYFLAMWHRIGRDPERGVVIPRFHPPEDLSPAVVSYIYFRGFSSRMKQVPRAFVAALVSLATKGYLRFDEADGEVSIHRERDLSPDMPPGERAIFSTAFDWRDQLAFDKANGPILLQMVSHFSRAILREYGNRFFRDNRWAFVIGLVLSAVLIVGALLLYGPDDDEIAALAATLALAAISAVALSAGVRRLRGSVPGGSVLFGVLMTFIGAAAFVVFALTFAIPGATPFLLFRLGLAVLVFVNVTFLHLLTAPTVQGQKVMEEIDGFRMYLSVAEAERMNMEGAPDFNTEVFERYLPYAIGLDVEKPWSEALEAHLVRTGQTGTYRPRYYHGRSWNSNAIATSTAAMASTVGSSIASAMPAPKSSGASGGGSSGGGGGGGGGGGW